MKERAENARADNCTSWKEQYYKKKDRDVENHQHDVLVIESQAKPGLSNNLILLPGRLLQYYPESGGSCLSQLISLIKHCFL